MANIRTHDLKKAETALKLAQNDLIAFGKLFLPDDFRRSETPPFHYEIADIFDDKTIKQTALILPRGHGKTVLTKASILKDFCFADPKDIHFYGWVSATYKLSVGNMDYIKYHLANNEKLKYYFGDLKGGKWTEEDIELTNGCKLISRSNVAGIRGAAKLHRRYDLVILDDFEHEANTISQESRDKNANLVTAVVYPALEPHTGRLRVNGTPVHYDAFINRLLKGYLKAVDDGTEKDFAWKVIYHQAIENNAVLWDSFFNMAKLDEKKKFYLDSGQPQKFAQEYMMQVISEEDALWTDKHIIKHNHQYVWDEILEQGFIRIENELLPVNTFIGCDPATDIDTKVADFSVIMVVAIDLNNVAYVLEYERHRSIPTIGQKIKNSDGEEMIQGRKGVVDYIIDLYEKYHCESATVEDVAMNRSIFQSLNSERQRLNKFDVSVIAEKPGGTNKRNRIYSGLSGRFSTGTIQVRENMFDLITEIVSFGAKMGKDDTIETLHYALLHTYPPDVALSSESNEYEGHRPIARGWRT
ncbi:hypothetical protein ACFL4H_00085 [Candidatus Neomarinimicrobiota bacterium]